MREANNNISKAVELVGGQTKLGELLGGVTQGSIWDWMNKYGQAPAHQIRKISKLTSGVITVDQLLDDHEENAKKKPTRRKNKQKAKERNQ